MTRLGKIASKENTLILFLLIFYTVGTVGILLPEYKRGSHDRWIRKGLDCGFLVLQVGQG